ncbi:hypothetical protein T492DRAFT_850647 [Pavlovales sp. CCMP2436]|nr:hypothetical protein T492DRAFT_850647 [Pavlovales sp. CCMP2436]
MSSRSSVDRDDFASMDDELAMKRKRTTEFARSVKLIASLFEANDLALVRGNLPRATYVMQRVRQDGFITPLWENLGGSDTTVPLTNAIYMMGGPELEIQSYVRRAACNVVGIAAAVHGNVEFPDVPAYSGEYVFANGVLDLYGSTFTAFNDYVCTPNACAKKGFEMDFDPTWLLPVTMHHTSHLDSIIAMQEWDSAEEEFLIAMLGRLLFPVGHFDNWQACLMLIGVGGSGKTTVTDAVIKAGYSPEQVSYISNTIEKKIPFESLVKSSVVVATDVDKDLMSNLSQTDLHNIINGERVEINIKYGGRRTLQWVAPFMLVANVVPNWQDDQGQMTRPIVYFDFSKKPPTANSQLAAELKDHAVQVQILLRCSKVYRELAVRYKQDGIMPNILAKYYPRRAEVGSKVQQDNDPLVHFVSEVLVHSPGQYVSMASLREHKIRFCKLHEYDPKLVQFRNEFQNIVSAKDMKVYTSMHEITQSNRAKNGHTTAERVSVMAKAPRPRSQGYLEFAHEPREVYAADLVWASPAYSAFRIGPAAPVEKLPMKQLGLTMVVEEEVAHCHVHTTAPVGVIEVAEAVAAAAAQEQHHVDTWALCSVVSIVRERGARRANAEASVSVGEPTQYEQGDLFVQAERVREVDHRRGVGEEGRGRWCGSSGSTK